MTEREYIDVGNLARLRAVHSVMSWLHPGTPEEHKQFNAAQKALHAWTESLEKKLDGKVTG